MDRRVTLIVLDSLGIGAAHDAHVYGDDGADTLHHIIKSTGIKIPNLTKMGILQKNDSNICSSFGFSEEISKGKGTIEGHWEMMGIETKIPSQTFPNGFPTEMLDMISKETGYSFLGNKAASGTEIIKELGKVHMETGKPIVYTSADSVFQIACHEETFGLTELYNLCSKVREILNKKWNISRVIARPFVGTENNFIRTTNRKDYSIMPPKENLLNNLTDKGISVVGVGKIGDIFSQQGIKTSIHTDGNTDGINKTISILSERPKTDEFVFVNLVDFDMLYGHRRDVNGYGKAIVEFDNELPNIMNCIKENDILIITADHGCDPTYKGTDHTRENIPILVYGKNIKRNYFIGKRKTFADIGQTISQYFSSRKLNIGTSFLNEIII